MKKVLVIQRRLTHYRVSFFEALREEMKMCNMSLILAYGEPSLSEAEKNDAGEIEWANKLHTSYFFGEKICWQPFYKLAKEADIIVIAHENKLIFNLFIQWFFPEKKVILWGHGKNLQRQTPDIRDKFKKITACKADWWFGYTDYSLPLILNNGFLPERITILNNSIDTLNLRKNLDSISEADIEDFKNYYNISGGLVGVYIGSFYKEKCIDFLIKSIFLIKENVPDFEFIFAGDGPEKKLLEKYLINNSWIKYVGLIQGKNKAILLSISKFILNPGAVGLGVLDSFVSKKPLLTTSCDLHGPEIAYLSNHRNSLITEYTVLDYVTGVINVIENKLLYNLLCEGCGISADLYSVQNMAKNFTKGVNLCINSENYRSRVV